MIGTTRSFSFSQQQEEEEGVSFSSSSSEYIPITRGKLLRPFFFLPLLYYI
jgi:hypothetical protein